MRHVWRGDHSTALRQWSTAAPFKFLWLARRGDPARLADRRTVAREHDDRRRKVKARTAQKQATDFLPGCARGGHHPFRSPRGSTRARRGKMLYHSWRTHALLNFRSSCAVVAGPLSERAKFTTWHALYSVGGLASCVSASRQDSKCRYISGFAIAMEVCLCDSGVGEHLAFFITSGGSALRALVMRPLWMA